jgi:hypothetical protein
MESNMTATAFSQRDPQWRAEPLGAGPKTIGQVGCLLTASAALLATWGVDTDPRRLNQWLIAHQGYANGNLMRFSAVTPFGVHFVNYINCATVPAPVQQLIQAVSGGAGVLVCVDSQPGGTVQPHWVYLISLDKTDGQIVDPWQLPGRESRRLTSYFAPGWDIARGIFHVAIYRRSQVIPLGEQRSLIQTPLLRKSRAIVQDGLCHFRKT